MLKQVKRAVGALVRTTGLRVVRDAHYGSDRYLDEREFLYILWLDRIYQKIRRVPGNIVEVGVDRGRNAVIFGQLIRLCGESAIRRYYGFDTFEGYTAKDLRKEPHLSRAAWKQTSFAGVAERIRRAGLDDLCHLVEGDIRETASSFLQTAGPNYQAGAFRTALVYIDCNAFEPALAAMRAFRGVTSNGGIICIDEKRQGGETRALEAFAAEARLTVERDAGPFGLPAYVRL